MKHLQFEFLTEHEFQGSVSEHSFTLRCLPFSDNRQTVSESKYFITPEATSWYSRDSFGNQLICGRISESHDSLSFRVKCDAYIKNSPEIYGSAEKYYFYHSPLTAVSDEITEFYKDIKFESSDKFRRAVKISETVNSVMAYERGNTDVGTDAKTSFALRKGVCQDYVHIFLSLCRLDGIACRYVSGLAFESGETHAWAEFHNGEKWIGIDPTNAITITDDYIKFCHGRDYSDCPTERGVYLGSSGGQLRIQSKVIEI